MVFEGDSWSRPAVGRRQEVGCALEQGRSLVVDGGGGCSSLVLRMKAAWENGQHEVFGWSR
jgi:hypothetical protein